MIENLKHVTQHNLILKTKMDSQRHDNLNTKVLSFSRLMTLTT